MCSGILACWALGPTAQLGDAARSLTQLLMSLWFALASLQPPLRPPSRQCVYGFNTCPHALLHSDPTLYIRHHLPARGWNDATQHKLKVKAMFALLLVADPRASAPCPDCWCTSCASFGMQAQPTNPNTLWRSHHKLSVDFIGLAKNQLVNYLISKALWVSAELPPVPAVFQGLFKSLHT